MRIALNTGPMIRAEANEYNFVHEPHFYHLTIPNHPSENINYKKIEIPHEPGEDVLSTDHISAKDTSIDVDVTKLTEDILNQKYQKTTRQIITKEIFNNKSINKRIRHKMKEIYANARARSKVT